MRKIHLIFLSFVIFASIISLGLAQPAYNPAPTDNQFAFDLYSHLSTGNENVFFSPYSLSNALSMAYEGARGDTRQQIRVALRFNTDDAVRRIEDFAFIQDLNDPNKNYDFSVANALWAEKKYPFKKEYLKIVEETYSAEARNLDFKSNPEKSRATINGWVSAHTNNHINDLLPAGGITSGTRLVLTNAVYFKGRWNLPFNKMNTKVADFWITPDRSVRAGMMMLMEKSFNYMENDQVQILQLPYLSNDLSMLIILSRSKNIQGLEKILTLKMLDQWRAGMKLQGVNVFFPRFKFDANYQMKDILKEMGIEDAFDQDADFSGMSSHKDLMIDQVYHKTWIDVNEQGTEAAAATAVAMRPLAIMAPLDPRTFRADHPFIFMIQDNKTGHILFMGRVSDPREK